MGKRRQRRLEEKITRRRKNRAKKPKLKESHQEAVWTFEERCRLVEALDSKFSGFNDLVVKHVASKPFSDVTNYAKFYKLLENGNKYKEFEEKTPIDVWIELAERATKQGGKEAEVCIPQIMTVSALEPQPDKGGDPNSSPNFSNIYNYLAMILKGEEAPDLPPIDAQVVLDLLVDLIGQFANSYTTLQREFLHDAFRVLNGSRDDAEDFANIPQPDSSTSEAAPMSENSKETETHEVPKQFSSFNPFNVPAILLDFKMKKPIALDFSTKWRTKV